MCHLDTTYLGCFWISTIINRATRVSYGYIYSHLLIYFFWINSCMWGLGSFLCVLPNYLLEILYRFIFLPIGHESMHFLKPYQILTVINFFNICWGPKNWYFIDSLLASIWFLIRLNISYTYWLFGFFFFLLFLLFINFLFVVFCHLSFCFPHICTHFFLFLALCYASCYETFS